MHAHEAGSIQALFELPERLPEGEATAASEDPYVFGGRLHELDVAH